MSSAANPNQRRLPQNLVQKFINEIESDEFDDDRPQEIQDREKTFEDGLDTFIKQGFQDFINTLYVLKKPIDIKEKTLFQKLLCFSCTDSSSPTDSEIDRINLSAKNLATHLENFQEYFKSIRGLNNGLMDQLKKVFNKITSVSFNEPIEPEKEIDLSSIFDENNMEDIKKTLIDIISQAMTCRFNVVYTINWIRIRLDYMTNKAEWMTIREDLVKLIQTYGAIEFNLNEYLTSFDEMILNPDKRDDKNRISIKVKKVIDYFKETIEEGKFNSMTEEIIEKIERLDMISTIIRERLLEYSNVVEQEMKDKLTGTKQRERKRSEREIEMKIRIDIKIERERERKVRHRYDRLRKQREIEIEKETETLREKESKSESEIEREIETKIKEEIERVRYRNRYNEIFRDRYDEMGWDRVRYRNRYEMRWDRERYRNRYDILRKEREREIEIEREIQKLRESESEIEIEREIKIKIEKEIEREIRNKYHGIREERKREIDLNHENNLNQLQKEINGIRSTLVSFNNLDQMVAKTIEAIETLRNQPITTDSDSDPLK